ncbi:G protein-coupled receptor rhodopsin-like, partial [Trinorchestia longiramus]
KTEAYEMTCNLVSGNGAGPAAMQDLPPRTKRIQTSHLEKSLLAKKRVTKMLFVVVFEFFVCWTPIFIVNILVLYIPEKLYKSLGMVGISFLHLLAYASSCCNPITYCFMNRRFVQAFLYAFGCRKSRVEKQRCYGSHVSFRSASQLNVRRLRDEHNIHSAL